MAALTHCHVLEVSEEGSFLFKNSHPKACHIVNVKDDDHLKGLAQAEIIKFGFLI